MGKSKIFPDIQKKSNIVPVHKQDHKQVASNYRPLSLLPACRKILESLVFNSFFDFHRPVSLLLVCRKISEIFIFNSTFDFLDNNSLLSAN